MDKITHKVRCEQWTKIIKECLASGMSKTAWCREHGISDKAFFYWQRRLREDAYVSTLESSSLPAVQIAIQNGHLCHVRRSVCDIIGGQPKTN